MAKMMKNMTPHRKNSTVARAVRLNLVMTKKTFKNKERKTVKRAKT